MRILVFLGLLLLAGCVEVIKGSEQEVSIAASPADATIELSNGQTCVNPCQITAARDEVLVATVAHPGCATRQAVMNPKFSMAGQMFGTPVAYLTGAAYELFPNPVWVTLECFTEPTPTVFQDLITPEPGSTPDADAAKAATPRASVP
jgi:hypothetical protein